MGTAHGQAGDAVSQLFAAANQCRGRGGSVVRHLGWQPVGTGLHNLCASTSRKDVRAVGQRCASNLLRHRKFSSAAPSDATALRCVGL